jgi:hypothetical protein
LVAYAVLQGYRTDQLAEFLLLNHLYYLERDAIDAGDDVSKRFGNGLKSSAVNFCGPIAAFMT